jgi:hypothetical protein
MKWFLEGGMEGKGSESGDQGDLQKRFEQMGEKEKAKEKEDGGETTIVNLGAGKTDQPVHGGRSMIAVVRTRRPAARANNRQRDEAKDGDEAAMIAPSPSSLTPFHHNNKRRAHRLTSNHEGPVDLEQIPKINATTAMDDNGNVIVAAGDPTASKKCKIVTRSVARAIGLTVAGPTSVDHAAGNGNNSTEGPRRVRPKRQRPPSNPLSTEVLHFILYLYMMGFLFMDDLL